MFKSNSQQHSDLITGALLLGLSGLLFWGCMSVKDFAATGVGAGFVPRLTAGLLLIVGLAIVASAWRTADRQEKCSSTPTDMQDTETDAPFFGGLSAALTSIALMVAYLYLLTPLGFILSSAAYAFLQMLVLTKNAKKRYLLFAIAATLPAALAYYLFANVFEISLPAGLWLEGVF